MKNMFMAIPTYIRKIAFGNWAPKMNEDRGVKSIIYIFYRTSEQISPQIGRIVQGIGTQSQLWGMWLMPV